MHDSIHANVNTKTSEETPYDNHYIFQLTFSMAILKALYPQQTMCMYVEHCTIISIFNVFTFSRDIFVLSLFYF